MEFQQDFLNRDSTDMTSKLPPIRCTDDFKRDVNLLCASMGLKYSILIRLVLGKMIASQKTYPREMRADSLHEIETVTNQVYELVPVIRQQRQHNPRMYNDYTRTV